MKIHRSRKYISVGYLGVKKTNICSRSLDGVMLALNRKVCLEGLLPFFINKIPRILMGHNKNKMFWACSLDPVIEKTQLEISL